MPTKSYYDANYGNFKHALYEEIRREAFGTDIGQNSWLTADEQDAFLDWLDLPHGARVLDVACGTGGPTLRIAAETGCAVVGVDIHEQGIATARSLAAERNLDDVATFETVDATELLPFDEGSFDAVICIDAINHLPDRLATIADWARVLRPGGRLLFTDPGTITGPLTAAEVAVRSSVGTFLFVPFGYDEMAVAANGLRLVGSKDVTRNMAEIAERRRASRQARIAALREIEGAEAADRQQEFLATAALLAREGRLSRFAYLAEKP